MIRLRACTKPCLYKEFLDVTTKYALAVLKQTELREHGMSPSIEE